MPNSVQAGIWRHYKGGLYLVLGLGRHTGTGQEGVIYVPLYDHPEAAGTPALQFRPFEEWYSVVEGDFTLKDGTKVSFLARFEFLGARR